MRNSPRWENLAPKWGPARLLSLLRNERRAVSILLAVTAQVPPLASQLLKCFGVRATKDMRAYKETGFPGSRGGPDGALVVEGRDRKSAFLFEAKIRKQSLRQEQVERYARLARAYDFDGMVTLSNDISASPEVLPIPINGHLRRSIPIRHLSWALIATMVASVRRQVGLDRHSRWLLDELFRFLQEPNGGTGSFRGMGGSWTQVRNQARAGKVRAGVATTETHGIWQQYVEYLALQLQQALGLDDPPRIRSFPLETVRSGHLKTRFRGFSVNDLHLMDLDADLTEREVTVSALFNIRPSRRALTRFLEQGLENSPVGTLVQARFGGRPREAQPVLRLPKARSNPLDLFMPGQYFGELSGVMVQSSRSMGTGGGNDPGSFVGRTRRQLLDFVKGVVMEAGGYERNLTS